MPLPYRAVWALVLADNKYQVGDDDLLEISGSLPPEDLEEAGEVGVYARIAVPSRNRPKVQWVRGEQDEFTFTATFVNDGTVVGEANARGHAQKMRAILKKAVRGIYALGRPPKFHFTYGSQILPLVFVREVSPIRFSTTLDRDYNSIMITMDIRLEVLDEDELTFGDFYTELPSAIPVEKEGLAIQVKGGDTWESISAEYYNNPDLGVAARQSSKIAFPGSLVNLTVAARTVLLPERQVLSRAGVQPRAVPMQHNRGDVRDAFNVVYALRLRAPFPGPPPALPVP